MFLAICSPADFVGDCDFGTLDGPKATFSMIQAIGSGSEMDYPTRLVASGLKSMAIMRPATGPQVESAIQKARGL
jgi:hypothetical protein